MARGLLPRVTPPNPFLPTPFSLSFPYPRRSGSSVSSSYSSASSLFAFSFTIFYFFYAFYFSIRLHHARLIVPRHLLCPSREYYACTFTGADCVTILNSL